MSKINNINQDIAPSFKDYLFQDHSNRTILWMAVISIFIQLIIFKYFYPYASYIHGDSFVYLDTAYHNLSINTYMIGYSMFLRAFSVFSSSDTVLAAFQYLLLQASALSLLLSIFYFYRPTKSTRFILLFFMVFNPLFLYLGNLVSSDAFFVALSLTWFTLLLWILHQPNPKLIILHTAVLFMAFTVRYNALIYLFIAAMAFFLSGQHIRLQLVGLAASVVTIGLFILYTGSQYKALTGTWQYSPFAGWQWANNAMYAYRYVNKADRQPVPGKFQPLDNMIREYFDSTRDIKKFPVEAAMASTFYMWSPSLPLFHYRDGLYKKDNTTPELKKWASMGPFYKSYGIYIAKHYPWHFIQYFLWPNANKYYAPPVEFLDSYNSSKDSVAPIASIWFGYKSLRVTTRTKDLKIHMLDFYPILSGIINVLMLFSLVFFLLLDGFKQDILFRKGILLGAMLWLLNAGFTIFASSAALRFQSFPILLTAVYAGLLIDWIAKIASIKKTIKMPATTLPRLPTEKSLV